MGRQLFISPWKYLGRVSDVFSSKCDVKDHFYTILVPQCYKKTFHISFIPCWRKLQWLQQSQATEMLNIFLVTDTSNKTDEIEL